MNKISLFSRVPSESVTSSKHRCKRLESSAGAIKEKVDRVLKKYEYNISLPYQEKKQIPRVLIALHTLYVSDLGLNRS